MSDEEPGRTSIGSLPLDQWRRARVEAIEVQEVEGVVDHPLITVWLEVRVLPGPPRIPSDTASPQHCKKGPEFRRPCGGAVNGKRSLRQERETCGSFPDSGLWRPQTCSWRRPNLPLTGSMFGRVPKGDGFRRRRRHNASY